MPLPPLQYRNTILYMIYPVSWPSHPSREAPPERGGYRDTVLSSCLRQVPPPCQPNPLGGGCSNDCDYDDADDNVAGDDDDDDDDGDDDDDHEEEEAELALCQRWDWLQLVDFVLNVAQVDRGEGGRNGRL